MNEYEARRANDEARGLISLRGFDGRLAAVQWWKSRRLPAASPDSTALLLLNRHKLDTARGVVWRPTRISARQVSHLVAAFVTESTEIEAHHRAQTKRRYLSKLLKCDASISNGELFVSC